MERKINNFQKHSSPSCPAVKPPALKIIAASFRITGLASWATEKCNQRCLQGIYPTGNIPWFKGIHLPWVQASSPVSSHHAKKTTLNIKHFSIIKLQLTTTVQPQSFLLFFPLLPRNPTWYFWQHIMKIPSGFITVKHGTQEPSNPGGLLPVGWVVEGDARTQKQISIWRLLLWAGLVGPRSYHSPTWSARFSAEQKSPLNILQDNSCKIPHLQTLRCVFIDMNTLQSPLQKMVPLKQCLHGPSSRRSRSQSQTQTNPAVQSSCPSPDLTQSYVICDQLQASWQSFGFTKEVLNAWNGQDPWIMYNAILF